VKLATIRVEGATRAVRETVVTEIKGVGRLENRVVKDAAR
jgi:hypothetical protein